MVRKKAWRVGSEQMNQLRATAKKFEGTHNFYNFTVGRDMKDRSSMRHMKLIEVEIVNFQVFKRDLKIC